MLHLWLPRTARVPIIRAHFSGSLLRDLFGAKAMILVRSSAGIRKPPTHRVVGLQLLITVLAAGFGWVFAGALAAKSALLGGLIVVLPSAYFAWRAFAYNATRSAAKVVGGFIQAELGKLLFTALLFAAVFKFGQPLEYGVVFAAFGGVLLGGLVGSTLLLTER